MHYKCAVGIDLAFVTFQDVGGWIAGVDLRHHSGTRTYATYAGCT